MLAGVLFGAGVDATVVKKMKLLIVLLTFLMIYPMMVTLNIKHLQQGLNLRLHLPIDYLALSLSRGRQHLPLKKVRIKHAVMYQSSRS
jgi:ACR3 family arsenite efflux pump ArsB